jgi:DNA-binding transcriptional LysR family regulator
MIATRVGEVRRVVCASPSLLQSVGTPAHPRELADFPCIHFQGLSTAPAWNFVHRRKTLTVSIDGPFTSNQAAVAVEACAEGLGFGRFLSYQVESLVEAKKLRIVLPAFEPPAIPIHIVFAHARHMTPRIRAFVDWMKTHL